MELSVWYSHNHKCFKTKLGYIPWNAEIGFLNGFGEELVAVLLLTPTKKSTKQIVIQFLKNVINRLEKGKKSKSKVVYIEKNHHQWWR